jgi:hypothetical protein
LAPPPRVPSPPPAAAPPPPAPEPAEADRGGHNDARRWFAYSLLAVGGGGLLLAVVEGSVAGAKADKIGMQSREGAAFDPAVEANGKQASATAIVSGVVGAAALAVGGLLLLTQPSRDDSPPPAGARATAGLRPATLAPLVGGGVVGAGAGCQF